MLERIDKDMRRRIGRKVWGWECGGSEDGEIWEEEFKQSRQRLVVQCKVSGAAFCGN